MQYKYSYIAHNNTVTDLETDDKHPNIVYSSSLDYSIKIWNLNSELKSPFNDGTSSGLYSPFSNDSYVPSSHHSVSTPMQHLQPMKKFVNKNRQKINALLHLSNYSVLASAG